MRWQARLRGRCQRIGLEIHDAVPDSPDRRRFRRAKRRPRCCRSVRYHDASSHRHYNMLVTHLAASTTPQQCIFLESGIFFPYPFLRKPLSGVADKMPALCLRPNETIRCKIISVLPDPGDRRISTFTAVTVTKQKAVTQLCDGLSELSR